VSKAELKEVKLEVGLPPIGFPRSMYFNRFFLEQEGALCLLHFGFVCTSGLMDSFACVITKEALDLNRDSIINYLNKTGRPKDASPPPWNGAGVEKRIHMVDIMAMAVRDQMAETCLYLFSHSAASRLAQTGSATSAIPAQPVALLRSTPEMQKHMIIGLYEG